MDKIPKEQRELYEYFDHMWDDLKKKPRKPKVKDPGKEMLALLKELDYSFKPKSTKKKIDYTRQSFRGGSGSKNQNAVLKMHYVSDKNKHLAFLMEYMTQLNKKDIEDKPILFSDEKVDIGFFNTYKEQMTDLHFRFIISPESQDVDLETASKAFIAKLNTLLGYNLNWVGSIHQNTDHKHAHILINGIDKYGHEVYFPKSFVKETGRALLQDICTSLVGYRSSKEIQQKKEREPFLERYTSLDEELLSKQQILKPKDEQWKSYVFTVDERLIQRCKKLEELGLAKHEGGNKYMLEKDWDFKLRSLGKCNAFKVARQNMKIVKPWQLELWDESKSEIDGIVTQLLYKDDEGLWSNCAVVENAALNKAYLISFPGAMPNYKIFGRFVHCGKFITPKGRALPSIQLLDKKQNNREVIHGIK